MITVTKSFEFCYAHHLPGYQGKCQRLHGHNARVEVTIGMSDYDFNRLEVEAQEAQQAYCTLAGHRQLYAGMVMDFGDVKTMMAEILNRLDHYALNDLPMFQYTVPTAENMAFYIAASLKQQLKDTPERFVQRVRVYETSDSYAEWTADLED